MKYENRKLIWTCGAYSPLIWEAIMGIVSLFKVVFTELSDSMYIGIQTILFFITVVNMIIFVVFSFFHVTRNPFCDTDEGGSPSNDIMLTIFIVFLECVLMAFIFFMSREIMR